MKKRSVIRVTPTLGTVSHWWSQAVDRLLTPMNMLKGSIFMVDEVGGMIAECRNAAVARVLKDYDDERQEAEAVFWLDDDVIPSPGALRQLHWHDKPIVSGVYFTKEPDALAQPLIFPSPVGGTLKYQPAPDGEQRSEQVWMGSMGLSLVKVEVYKRMLAELELGKDVNGNPQWYKTTCGQVEQDGDALDLGGTEDSFFMALAAKLGYTCTVDMTKYAFGFHYDAHSRCGFPQPQWRQYVAALAGSHKPLEWPMPDGTTVTWR